MNFNSNNMKTDAKITILLADDHPLVRLGLKAELKKNKNFNIIGEATTGNETIEKALKLKPNIILMDIGFPDMNGLSVLSILRERAPDIMVIALTMHKNINYVKEIMSRGGKGYVLKDSDPCNLVNAIYSAVRNEKFY